MNDSQQTKETRPNLLIIKTLAIIYLVCFICIYLTSNTEAQFTDTHVHNQLIQAGEWWDGSSLVFPNQDHQVINSCEPVELQAEIYNDSQSEMYDSTAYEVYQVSFDRVTQAVELGDKVSEGMMDTDIIGAYESSTLTYTATAPNDYIFKVYQRPGYNDHEEKRTSIISDVFTVNCVDEPDQETNK